MTKTLLHYYVLRDKVADTYLIPCLFGSDEEAARAFMDLCADDKSMVYKHREDFELWKIGDYDPIDGSLHEAERVCVITGNNVLLGGKHD